MKTAPIPPVHLQRRVTVARPATWQAISDPAIVARWFADVSPLGGVGDPYLVRFGDGTRIDGRLLAVETGRRFAYSWHWEHESAGRTTRVTWAVEPTSFGSRVVLEHDGWADAGLSIEDRDDHAGYWETYLDNLRKLIDPDVPEPPEEVV